MVLYKRTGGPRFRKKFRVRRKRRVRRSGLVRQLRAVGLAPELKFHEVTNSGTAVPDTGVIATINSIGQGDGDNDRDGAKIRIKSMYGKYLFQIHASATSTQIRHMIVIDRSPDGTAPTLAEILNDATIDDNLVSALNPDNITRFRIIRDRLYTLDDSNRQAVMPKFYMKCNYEIQFNSTTGDDVNQDIFQIFISNEDTNTPTVTSHLRLRFYG